MPKKKQTFEDSINKLEILVHDMETNKLTLNDLVKKYKESTALIQFCRQELDSADKTICKLLEINADGTTTSLNLETKENISNE
ncbi:exodeoxyribonuclease VII small subunit [Pectinatus frisingensis]|jgi:exodeoxyribonuclease VII small subunit|uniref:exodeoxyribonuclease VII small subunit n=1 Tax=Pectinatus frisingensis TaxID=865 RepID=UPI0015F5BCB7|nr:exodeoxyribonuclease VII small subunit [Pectinatus frisingensis]